MAKKKKFGFNSPSAIEKRKQKNTNNPDKTKKKFDVKLDRIKNMFQ